MGESRATIKERNKTKILEVLSKQTKPLDIQAIATEVNLPTHTTRRLLQEMEADYKVEITPGAGRGGSYEYSLPNIDFIPTLWHGRAAKNVDLVTLALQCANLNKSPVIAANFNKIAAAQLLLAVIDKADTTTLTDIRKEIYNNIQVLDNISKMLKQLLNHKKIWSQQVDFSNMSPFIGGGLLEKKFIDDVNKLLTNESLEDIRKNYSALSDVLNILAGE